MAPGENTEPREVVQTTPRDLHPTSDIRFVMVEIARLTTEVKRLIEDVRAQGEKLDDLGRKVAFGQGAVWVMGGLCAFLLVVVGWYFSGKVAIVVKPG